MSSFLPEEKKSIDKKAVGQKEKLNEVLQKVRALEKKVRDETAKVAKDALLFAVGHLFEELENKYQEI